MEIKFLHMYSETVLYPSAVEGRREWSYDQLGLQH